MIYVPIPRGVVPVRVKLISSMLSKRFSTKPEVTIEFIIKLFFRYSPIGKSRRSVTQNQISVEAGPCVKPRIILAIKNAIEINSMIVNVGVSVNVGVDFWGFFFGSMVILVFWFYDYSSVNLKIAPTPFVMLRNCWPSSVSLETRTTRAPVLRAFFSNSAIWAFGSF